MNAIVYLHPSTVVRFEQAQQLPVLCRRVTDMLKRGYDVNKVYVGARPVLRFTLGNGDRHD